MHALRTGIQGTGPARLIRVLARLPDPDVSQFIHGLAGVTAGAAYGLWVGRRAFSSLAKNRFHDQRIFYPGDDPDLPAPGLTGLDVEVDTHSRHCARLMTARRWTRVFACPSSGALGLLPLPLGIAAGAERVQRIAAPGEIGSNAGEALPSGIAVRITGARRGSRRVIACGQKHSIRVFGILSFSPATEEPVQAMQWDLYSSSTRIRENKDDLLSLCIFSDIRPFCHFLTSACKCCP